MRIFRFEHNGQPCFTVAGVQLYESDCKNIHDSGKYIVNSRGVYSVCYCPEKKGFYGKRIAERSGLTRRGRFFILTAHEVSSLLGCSVDALN